MKGKLIHLLIGLSIFVNYSVHSQTLEDVSKAEKIAWYGIDFTYVQLIGTHGFTNPDHIVEGMFDYWNNLVLKEPEKYNIKRIFSKSKIDYMIDDVMEDNHTVNPKELVTNESGYTIPTEKLQEIVNFYDTKGKTGPGVVVVMETMNKFDEIAFMYVVVFDQKTKKVIHTEKVSGTPGGAGIGNFWMRSIYNGLLEFETRYAKLR